MCTVQFDDALPNAVWHRGLDVGDLLEVEMNTRAL